MPASLEEPCNRDSIAGLERFNAFTDFGDNTNTLMPQDAPRNLTEIASRNVQVGVADAGVL